MGCVLKIAYRSNVDHDFFQILFEASFYLASHLMRH